MTATTFLCLFRFMFSFCACFNLFSLCCSSRASLLFYHGLSLIALHRRGIRAVRPYFIASGGHLFSHWATCDRHCMNIIECVVSCLFFPYVRSRQIPHMFERSQRGHVRVTRVRRAENDDFSSSRKVFFFYSHPSSRCCYSCIDCAA
jgi:hypothetical protein